MMLMIKRSILLFLSLGIVLLGVQPAFAGKPRNPDEYFFDQTLGDLKADLDDARSPGKKGLLIFFEQEECPFCYRMKTTVLNQPEIQDYFRKRFLIFAMDIKSTNEVNTFDGKTTTTKDFFHLLTNNRDATPVFAFFDLKGNLVVRYTGATSGVQEFQWLGQYASEGIYHKMPFVKYKREMRRQARK